MFTIYTPEGRTFSGSLERLRRVEKSAAAHTTRKLSDTETEISDQDNASAYKVSKKAVAQYRSLLQREEQREPVYHAYQVMSRTVRLINGSWSLLHTYDQFRRYPYQVFPVTDDRQTLIGTLSRQQFYAFLLDLEKPTATDTRNTFECFIKPDSKVYAADPVTDIRRIASLLVEKSLDALPVLEETGRIVGMVSRTDILRCTVSDPPLSLWC